MILALVILTFCRTFAKRFFLSHINTGQNWFLKCGICTNPFFPNGIIFSISNQKNEINISFVIVNKQNSTLSYFLPIIVKWCFSPKFHILLIFNWIWSSMRYELSSKVHVWIYMLKHRETLVFSVSLLTCEDIT